MPRPCPAPGLPAGVPSPVKLTPWKEKALVILALMRRQGFITAKQIAAHGHNTTTWTQPAGSKPAWLTKGAVRGQSIETEHMPAFDNQHPELYEIAVADLAAVAEKEFSLG